MRANPAKANSIDEYIAGFPESTQKLLVQLRNVVKEAAPGAEEGISYGMPVFKQNGNLVYFAAYKNHIGFYPAPSGIDAFKKELSAYKGAKGSVQFPLDKPIPCSLVAGIVAFRVEKNKEKATAKQDAKTKELG